MPAYTVFFEAIVPGSVEIEADSAIEAMAAVQHYTIDVTEDLDLGKIRIAYVDCDCDDEYYDSDETEIPLGGELS